MKTCLSYNYLARERNARNYELELVRSSELDAYYTVDSGRYECFSYLTLAIAAILSAFIATLILIN